MTKKKKNNIYEEDEIDPEIDVNLDQPLFDLARDEFYNSNTEILTKILSELIEIKIELKKKNEII